MVFEYAKEDDRFIYCHCHFHGNDETPSLLINKVENNGKPKGFYYCFSCGKSGSIPDKEVDFVARTVGKKKEPVNVDLDGLQNKLVHQITDELLTSLSTSWGISNFALEMYRIGYDNWMNYTFPFYDGDENIIGIQLRSLLGRKMCLEGSRLGLFLPYGEIGDIVAICEGVSDACVFQFCTGIYTIGRPNASVGGDMMRQFLLNRNFKGEILVISDRDNAGIIGTNKLLDNLSDWNVRVKIPFPYKDLRAKYSQEGVDGIKDFLR